MSQCGRQGIRLHLLAFKGNKPETVCIYAKQNIIFFPYFIFYLGLEIKTLTRLEKPDLKYLRKWRLCSRKKALQPAPFLGLPSKSSPSNFLVCHHPWVTRLKPESQCSPWGQTSPSGAVKWWGTSCCLGSPDLMDGIQEWSKSHRASISDNEKVAPLPMRLSKVPVDFFVGGTCF